MDHLVNNPLITDVQQITFDASFIADITGPRSEDILARIHDEAPKVSVYRIEYQSNGHMVVGFIAEPQDGDNLPCIIRNRGGSKDFGAWTNKGAYLDLSHWAALGYVAVTTQYSGNGGSEGKDEMGGADLQDVFTLREILQHHPRANADMIGMYGASRGGMMTYLTMAQTTWLKAAVTLAGSADLQRNHELRPELKEWHSDMFDVSDPAEIEKRSAVCWVEKFCKTTPLLMLHGTADWRVSVLDSLELAVKLYENKVPYRLQVFEGGDHSLTEFRPQQRSATEKWFERYLQNNEPLPNLEPHGD